MTNLVLVKFGGENALIDPADFRRIEIESIRYDATDRSLVLVGHRHAVGSGRVYLAGPYTTWKEAEGALLNLAHRMGVTT